MSDDVGNGEGKGLFGMDKKTQTIVIIVVAVLCVCCLIPICVIVALQLMEPAIGDVFSNILMELQ